MRKVIIMFALAMGIVTANAQENVTLLSARLITSFQICLQYLCHAPKSITNERRLKGD